MNTDLTTAEMRSRLEELKRQLEEGDKGYTGLVITSVAVVGPAVDLAFEALARREREYEASPCFLCGWRPKFHPREGHEFTPWPATKEPEPDCLVTDGEAG